MSIKCNRCGAKTRRSYKYPELSVCTDTYCQTYQSYTGGDHIVVAECNCQTVESEICDHCRCCSLCCQCGGPKAKTLTLFSNVRDGVVDVMCVKCADSIGTMTMDILSDAIKWAMDKGGVMCPLCRWLSCEQCGGDLETRGSTLFCPACKRDDSETRCSDNFLSSSSNLNKTPPRPMSEDMALLFKHIGGLSVGDLEVIQGSLASKNPNVSRETIS